MRNVRRDAMDEVKKEKLSEDETKPKPKKCKN